MLRLMLLLAACAAAQQVADKAYDPPLAHPSYAEGKGPVVLMDEAHHNFHTSDGRYEPFARLLQRDGYVVKGSKAPFSKEALAGARVLVIANAIAERNQTDWSLPTPSAFTDPEIAAVVEWVRGGGSLLLIADHMPFAGAAEKLGAALGVRFSNGFAFDVPEAQGPDMFTRDSGLADHPITRGIDSVATFTGSAFQADAAQPLLVLGPKWVSLTPKTAWNFDKETPRQPAAGWLQGGTLEIGKGRVAVFGEAAMFSAQLAGPQKAPAGMNHPRAAQNYRLLLNVMRWLAPAAVESRLVFPLESWHNHSSSIVELPDGELMVCWYHGSGERTADDVKVEAARLPRGAREWGARFTLADTPNFPDTNPVLFVDSRSRLWLMWPAILANRWETAIMKYRIASDPRSLKWDVSDNLLFIPPNFEAKVRAAAEPLLPNPAVQRVVQLAGDKFASRIGWMPRTHPLELPSGRILVPLYSDGYDFSIVAITDDGGATWTASEPIVGPGAVQPSLVRKKDGTIVAYMRDNGPPPKRVMVSESSDNGQTWSAVVDTDIPNSGTSVEAIALRDGTWLMVNNDTERGRNSLAVTLSDDEGKTWKWKRHLEREETGSFHYPSVTQARDGSIHVSYSYFVAGGKAIKHARFNPDWVKQ